MKRRSPRRQWLVEWYDDDADGVELWSTELLATRRAAFLNTVHGGTDSNFRAYPGSMLVKRTENLRDKL